MKTEDINKVLQEFETIETISPSENWDLVFQNKLDSVRLSKSSTITKINGLMIILVFVNICFIWNIIVSDGSEVNTSRASNLQTISNELLITNN
jgi:hypothetical protein